MSNLQDCKIYTLQEFLVFLSQNGRIKTSAMYEKAVRSFVKSLDDNNPNLADITEPQIKRWVDGLLPRLSIDTILRYIESLGRIYGYAVKSGLASDAELFSNIKEYALGLSSEGFDKESKRLVDGIGKLASINSAGLAGLRKAIDVYLFSFYHAGMPIEDVVALRIDDQLISSVAQAEAISAKYAAPIRRYVFPLRQWQRTTRQIVNELESALKTVARAYDISLGNKSPLEYIRSAWLAAAKSCAIPIEDICACCPSVAANSKLKSIEPSALSQAQIDDIKRKVANSIIDMNRYWYAIRFMGKEEYVRNEIERQNLSSPIRIYYPLEEICKKVGRRRIIENRPTIRNIMFLQAMPDTLDAIVRNRTEQSKFYVIRNKSTQGNSYAIIPNEQMRQFSVLVSNGLDILGDDEIKQVEIIKGSYVSITDGIYKGFCGRVLKVKNLDNSESTMLQIEADKFGPNMAEILGKHLYITIPTPLATPLDR